MPHKTQHFAAVGIKLAAYSAATSPIQTVQTSLGPVNYVDLPATGFYPGVHNGEEFDQDDIQSLEDTFAACDDSDPLYGTVPVCINHPPDGVPNNHDKIGHMRQVTTEGANSKVLLRVVGDNAIQQVAEGKLRSISAGLFWTEVPAETMDDDDEMAKDPEESDPDDDWEDGEWSDHGFRHGRQVVYSKARDRYRFKFGIERVAYSKKDVTYDHMAFVTRPALTGAKIDKFNKNKNAEERSKMPDNTTPEKPKVSELQKQIAELQAQAAENKASLAKRDADDAARAAAELAKVEADKAAAFAKRNEDAHQELCAAGFSCPASKEKQLALFAQLSDDQLALFIEARVAEPKIPVMAGIQTQQHATKPENQTPLANDKTGAGPSGVNGAYLLAKYSKAHHPKKTDAK